MRELILVRHGESEHHVRRLSGGWTDTPLTNLGRQQAKRVGLALASSETVGRTLLYSSDLLRARQTADAISEATGLHAVLCQQLRELNNGIARDRTLEEATAMEIPVTEPRVDWVPFPQAESWRDLSNRITGFMNEVASEHKGDTVILVSHGMSLRVIVHWWLQLGEEYWSSIAFAFDPASITRLSVSEWFGERLVSKLNDTAHLAGVG